ncbi:hypothetical protein GTA08_BOTSDO08059 [Neofusicoccum parvum]|nr:hypothetical protein GTA08_BOTSDO08059 [Neofusicoccum parvum]
MEIDTQTTRANDGSVIHYEARGKPSPEHPSLVFLHYYGGSPSTWAPLLAQPPFADFHTVCYHARGWAPSTGPPDPGAYGIEAMSSDLSAILSATGLRDSRAGFVLVGHSMGAKVAQHYAATVAAASPHLKGLVLVAPAPLRGLELPAEAKAQQRAAYESAESVRFVLDNVLTAAPGALAEDAVAACVGDSLRGNEWAKVAWPEYALGQGFGDLVDRIQAPVLVLRGDKDFEKDMVGLLGTDSGWINKDIENCGHLVPLEQPVQLGKEILAFVRKIS